MKKRIYATNIYETWDITKFEDLRHKPYIAHIFKYSLGEGFPITLKNLEDWCKKIKDINIYSGQENLDFKAFTCYNNKPFNVLTNDNSKVTYILFEKPDFGFRFSDHCNNENSRIRYCRYFIKNFTRGLMKLVGKTLETSTQTDVRLIYDKAAYFYGKMPQFEEAKQDDSTKNNNSNNQNSQNNQNNQNNGNNDDNSILPPEDPKPKKITGDKKKYFITVPFFKFTRPETISDITNLDADGKKVLSKITMSQIGTFLAYFYKGLKESENIKPHEIGDNFTPNEQFSGKKESEIFYILNEEDINRDDVNPENYFGVKPDIVKFIKQANKEKEKVKTSLNMVNYAFNGSFYEFVKKLTDFYENQFSSFDEAFNHDFISQKAFIKNIRSDTGDV